MNINPDDDDDITDCAKCRQLVGDPTTLPCLDSLCATCFKEVRDAHSGSSTGVATCPRCGDPFHLPTNHLQTLPDRGFVDTLVALRKIASQNLADDSCEICKQLSTSPERVAAAEFYCIECRQRMCATCCGPHRVFPATKNHNVVGLGIDSASRVLSAIKSFTLTCAGHKDRSAVVHCYQCAIGLCSQCQNAHLSHELEALTDQTYSQLTSRLEVLSEQMHQVLGACQEETGQVQKLLRDRRDGVLLAEKQINEKADELISLIQKQRDDLLKTLHSCNDQAISSLEAASGRLAADLSAKKRAARFAAELLEKGSVEDVLLNHRMLSSRVSRLHHSTTADASVPDATDSNNDVSPASLIHDVCTSVDPQSKLFSVSLCS